MICYIDESGDRGFAKGSSSHLVLTALILRDRKTASLILNPIRKKLRFTHIRIKEFHAYHTNERTKITILSEIAKLRDAVLIYAVVANKKLLSKRKLSTKELYGEVLSSLIRNVAMSVHCELSEILIDANEPKRAFERIVTDHINAPHAKISSVSSHNEAGMQLVDLISWTIYRKYEWGDSSLYKLIENQIRGEHIFNK